MKRKNEYFRLLEEESDLLRAAAQRAGTERAGEIRELRGRCLRLHYTLCRRLIREFITPWEREDLYRISDGVQDCLAVLDRWGGALSDAQAAAFRHGAETMGLSCLCADASAVTRAETVDLLCEKNRGTSDASDACFSALQRLSRRLLDGAIKNA